MHVVTTRRVHKGKVYRAHLLRRSFREDGKVKNETLANLSHLPDPVVDLVRRGLRGDRLVHVDDLFDVQSSPQDGNVAAVLSAMHSLGFEDLVASKRCRERDLVIAMVAARILRPSSKLATTRWWTSTTLPRRLGVEDATENDLYAAMDWLLERQSTIERKLAKRHLRDGGLVLYDLTSSYFHGTKCPLARLGHSRDGRKGTLQVNYGLVTDELGCPVSVSVFPGNTNDSTTLLGEVEKIRGRFEIESLVVVGDRGMISQKQIDALDDQDGVAWVTALRSGGLRDLVQRKALQLELFDQRNLFEFDDPERPGERFVACRNPALTERRAQTRKSLLDATTKKLDVVKQMVSTRRLRGRDRIGIRVGRVINSHKVGKHFDVEITDDDLRFTVNHDRVAAEAALDGVYVIRSNVRADRMSSSQVVVAYKQLTNVERGFRSLKTMDLHVRPIHHWSEERVRAHIFLCMLSLYVQYHLQEAWRPLLFSDEEAWTNERVDPVAPARRSAGAETKARKKVTADGEVAHSLRTLLDDLGSIVCNRCRRKGADDGEATIEMLTKPSPLQRRALDLADAIAL